MVLGASVTFLISTVYFSMLSGLAFVYITTKKLWVKFVTSAAFTFVLVVGIQAAMSVIWRY